MREVNGEIAQNARININYSGKKPKVSFSYPVKNKDSSTTGDMMSVVFMAWMIINLPLFIYIIYFEDPYEPPYEEYNYTSYKEYNTSDYLEYLEYYTQKGRIDYYYEAHNTPTKEFLLEILIPKLFFTLLYLIGTPCLIYFPFRKKWDKLFPDYQAFWARKKYAKFNSKNIKQDDKLFYIELPIFYNIICDFKATKDFSKHLKYFRIKEYNFKHHTLRNKKKLQNEIIWYARWYFNEEPKTGFLEVIFR